MMMSFSDIRCQWVVRQSRRELYHVSSHCVWHCTGGRAVIAISTGCRPLSEESHDHEQVTKKHYKIMLFF